MKKIALPRRHFLATAGAAFLAQSALAKAPMLGAALPNYRRIKLGAFEVTTLLTGTTTRATPQDIFGLNVSSETFASVSAANNIPADATTFFFTPTLVNTGNALVLFDTGMNQQGIYTALRSAGYQPEQVDIVVISHMHGDHIGGLSEGGVLSFPNARYIFGADEFDEWDMSGNEAFEEKVRPLAEQATMIEPIQQVVSGISAMNAFGHTPGHMTYMLESEGSQLLLAADFANHYVWSLAYPDWHVLFDRDKAAAAATRRRLLGMLAADKMPFIGYHMPFPAIGYVETRGDGFVYVPQSYQLML